MALCTGVRGVFEVQSMVLLLLSSYLGAVITCDLCWKVSGIAFIIYNSSRLLLLLHRLTNRAIYADNE